MDPSNYGMMDEQMQGGASQRAVVHADDRQAAVVRGQPVRPADRAAECTCDEASMQACPNMMQ